MSISAASIAPVSVHHTHAQSGRRPFVSRMNNSAWLGMRTLKMQDRKAKDRGYTQGEVTSQSLWSRYGRHFVGITRYNALSEMANIYRLIQIKLNQLV